MHPWWIHVMWEVELVRAMQDAFSFTLCLPGVNRSPVSPRAVVLCSPLGLNINAFNRGSFSTPQSLADNKTWVSNTTRGQRINIRGLSPHPIQRVGAEGGATWDLIQGFGYSGSSLHSWLSLSSAKLLYREDFLLSVRIRRGLVSSRAISFRLITRRC